MFFHVINILVQKCFIRKNRKLLIFSCLRILKAEREGFEPPVPLGTTVFKTVVIDHSTISPCKMTSLVFLSGCKGTTIFLFCQIFVKLFLIFL